MPDLRTGHHRGIKRSLSLGHTVTNPQSQADLQRCPRLKVLSASTVLFRFKELNIAARYILGADGARSAAARDPNLGRNTRFLTGIRGRVRGARLY